MAEFVKWNVWIIDKALTWAWGFENLPGIAKLADAPKGLLTELNNLLVPTLSDHAAWKESPNGSG